MNPDQNAVGRTDPITPEADARSKEAGSAARDTRNGDGTDLAAAQAAAAELEDRFRRALADLDNLRKRYARELDRERGAERGRVAGKFLPVLDNLERALGYAEADPASVLTGLQAVREQALAVLGELGYPRQGEVGVPFDPLRHEVVAVVDDPDAAPGTVVNVVLPGYGRPDRQLRPAAVTVAGQREQVDGGA